MTYSFLNVKSNKAAIGGLTDVMYLAPLQFFNNGGLKSPEYTEGGTPETLVEVNQTHTFRQGKGFLQINLEPLKNKISTTTIGNISSQAQQLVLEVFVPGSYANLHGMFADIKNLPMAVLIKDRQWCKEGKYYQIGSFEHPAYVSGSFETGTPFQDKKGYKIKITAINNAIWLYSGLVKFYGLKFRRYTREFNSSYF